VASELASHLRNVGMTATACDSIEDGVRTARDLAGKDGVVLCFGSLYTIGAIKESLDTLTFGEHK
jgi:folylpolyglutamate synthase/dihydropteroate synthase